MHRSVHPVVSQFPMLLVGCVALLLGWTVIGLAGLVRPRSVLLTGRLLFPLGALLGLALAVLAGASLLGGGVERLVLPVGLPNLPMHLRLDPLSSIFLVLLGASSFGISLFAGGYFRVGEGTAPGLLCLQYHLFLAAMGLVLIADDAYSFLVAWE
ncbi:hydrogenase 4 subunit B [mine drainage metagenome]|uniref:Hydrogenase 4 subunit B n=1 Tax=mine drainage metagenome TaxID=410659 RepID=T1CEK3_9ZZZZ